MTKEFLKVEPLLAFDPPHQEAWCRVATNEAKAPGTFAHIGYASQPFSETVLTFDNAVKLHTWLGKAIGVDEIFKPLWKAAYVAEFVKVGLDAATAESWFDGQDWEDLKTQTPEEAAAAEMEYWSDDGDGPVD